jgi:uncharacterized protein HemX
MNETPKKPSKRKSKKRSKKAGKNAIPETSAKAGTSEEAATDGNETTIEGVSAAAEPDGAELDETSALDVSATAEQVADELDETSALDMSATAEQVADELDETSALDMSATAELAGDELDETSALDMSETVELAGDELDQTATLDVSADTGHEDEALDKTATLEKPIMGKESPVSATAQPAPKKRWRRLGWTIVIIVVLAAAGSVYLMWKQQGAERFAIATDSDIAALRNDLQDTDAAVADLQKEVAAIREENEKFQRQISNFANEVNKRLQAVESQGARVTSLEGAVASIQGISQGSRNTWLLAEAEYYLQIANAQLNLAGNPGHALLALKLADERVRELADPAFTEVRRALADEIQTLETFSKVDVEGISLTLASLSRVVDSLPIQEQFIEPEDEPAAEDTAEDLSGLDRAGAAVRDALKGVVSVRRVDEQARPLLAPEAQYFLRANLALQFQAARLALLRGEKASFEQSLDDAATWLNDHFVADSAPVVSALATIEDIRDTTLDVEYPDISGSLTLLRQQRTLASDVQ